MMVERPIRLALPQHRSTTEAELFIGYRNLRHERVIDVFVADSVVVLLRRQPRRRCPCNGHADG